MFNHETVHAGEHSFHCLTAGSREKPFLLFLHGFPEYSGAWEEVMERLADRFFCVAPDQRGYGLSSKPQDVSAYAAGKLAQDAAAILTHFAPRARAVVGHDWGASVAYALSFSRPDLMEKLIIMNGAHPVPFQRATAAGGAQSAASQYFHYLRSEKAEARLSADNYGGLAKLFAEGMDMSWLTGPRREKYIEAWSQPGALTGMLNWYRAAPIKIADPGKPIPESELPQLDPARLRVTVPHLLIWGGADKALLPDVTEELEEFCDDLTRAEIEEVDHWLAHQKPDDVAAHIANFVEK